MDLETRAYLCPWMTQEETPGLVERVPRILQYALQVQGHSWSAVEIPDQDQCLVLLTYDKDVIGAVAVAAAFATVEAAPRAEVLSVGELSQDFATRPTRTAVLARCEAHRIPQTVVGAMASVRGACREIVRRALLFQEVGYPPAALTEEMGTRLTQWSARAAARGFREHQAVRSNTTIGAAYATLATSPRAHYGLESGSAVFGHPAVHLGVGGLRT